MREILQKYFSIFITVIYQMLIRLNMNHFTVAKSNWNNLGILPFGQPVMFQEIGEVGRFQDKAKLGAYVSPARNTVGREIVVVNWKTKRHFVSSTYRILK